MNQFFLPLLPALALTLQAATIQAAQEPLPRSLYQMSTRTGMPNLAENLRYAVVREQRCLGLSELATAFWMLQDVSLQDCVLALKHTTPDKSFYTLKCSGGHGTTGNAVWQREADQLTGTMNVRLGAKNMTFYQRIVATKLRPCD